MKKKKNKIICYVAIFGYVISIILSVIVCLLINVKDYVYLLIIMGVSVMYVLLFFIICYDSLYQINDYDEEIKAINIKTNLKQIICNLMKSDFTYHNEIFLKTYRHKKLNFKRLIYISCLDKFEIALEEFLLKSKGLLDNKGVTYFEAYIILFPQKNEDYSKESQKEINANHYKYPNIQIPLKDKLFKCVVYNSKTNILYYNKNNVYSTSLDALDFIEDELIKFMR